MPIAISLFAGAGGCSLGFQRAQYEILYASDINPTTVATYRRNFPSTECFQQDIRNVNFHHLLESLALKNGSVDFLIGGPPCQGFSTAGTRFWDDPRNALLKQYVRALQIIKPKWFLMENVEGLLTTKKGEYLYEATKAFIELGYKLRIDKIYAHEYGIPQRRKRVFIIGNRLGYDFELPPPRCQIGGAIYRKADLCLWDAIGELPMPCSDPDQHVAYDKAPASEWEREIRSRTGRVCDHHFPRLNPLQLQRIRALKSGQTMKDLPEHLQHSSFKRRAYRRVMDGTPTEKRGGAPSGLKRLVADEPSLTITGASTRELIHPLQDRPLTVRECARIQTFPDDFDFCGTTAQRIKQIGNAIPPALAEIFAEHIKGTFNFESQSSPRGELLGFSLTKANAMSPALKHTYDRLRSLMARREAVQLSLFG